MKTPSTPCRRVRRLLIDVIYDELDRSDAAPVFLHLQQCEVCRGEFDELTAAKKLLQFAVEDRKQTDRPPPKREWAGAAMAAATMRRHTANAAKSRRRWRGLTVSLVGLLLLTAAACSLRVEFYSTHWVVQWGDSTAPTTTSTSSASTTHLDWSRRLQKQEARLAEMDQLFELMMDEFDRNDSRYHQLAVRLQERFDADRRIDEQRWRKMRLSIHALSLAEPTAEIAAE